LLFRISAQASPFQPASRNHRKDASFRPIVSGNIGVKEIERLIQKLEIDKEILADQDELDEAVNPEFSK
jgi:hypothetical protein